MGSYNENFENYRNSSLVENAEGFRDKNYMLIHGMFDKNVHFQHSAMLAKELQHRGIKFLQQVRHLYHDSVACEFNVFREQFQTNSSPA